LRRERCTRVTVPVLKADEDLECAFPRRLGYVLLDSWTWQRTWLVENRDLHFAVTLVVAADVSTQQPGSALMRSLSK
jgi:hypothetical protein